MADPRTSLIECYSLYSEQRRARNLTMMHLFYTALHFITDFLLHLDCHVKLKSIIGWAAQRLLCLAAPVCRGSSRVWRDASVVMAVMDSHRQVALQVTAATWTRV